MKSIKSLTAGVVMATSLMLVPAVALGTTVAHAAPAKAKKAATPKAKPTLTVKDTSKLTMDGQVVIQSRLVVKVTKAKKGQVVKLQVKAPKTKKWVTSSTYKIKKSTFKRTVLLMTEENAKIRAIVKTKGKATKKSNVVTAYHRYPM